jgi:hypothetical protein
VAKQRKRGALLGAKVTRTWEDGDRQRYERAIVYRVDREEDTLRVVDVNDDTTIDVPLSREGIEWCRGWSGPELRALKTVIAIGAPPRQHKGMS